ILTVPTLREATGSVVLSDVSGGVASLRGLEYATSLSSLDASDYDLSGSVSGLGYDDADAVYDRMVIQMLAKGVDYYTVLNIGLSSLSVQNTGIYRIEDVLDLTPIASSDLATSTFKLTTLDLSNNYISDVSVLITEGFFPADVMETLVLDDNYICDISGVVSTLNDYFTGTYFSSLTVSAQTCQCSESFSFADHKTCRRRSDDTYQVECWNGYYLDKELGTCVKATSSTDVTRCHVCELADIQMSVMEEGASDITCGCKSSFHGDTCEYVDIPDDNLRRAICGTLVPSRLSTCDDVTIEDLESLVSLSARYVNSFDGLQYSTNLETLSISGSDGITETDIAYLPDSMLSLTLKNVNLAADIDFSDFSNIMEMDLQNNLTFDITVVNLLPSTLTSLNLSGCVNFLNTYNLPSSLVSLYLDDVGVGASTSFAAFTGLETLSLVNSSSFNMSSSSQLPSSLKYLDLGGCSSFDGLSYLPTGLTTLSLDGVGIAADTSFVSFSSLTTLSVANNPLYNVASAGEFPSTITSLDISGCSS
ncbi:hypothetical protein ADUPG1_007288, partial [Aduncisulcus paluster]